MDFKVGDAVRVTFWYDPTEVGRIRAVDVAGVGFYDVEYDGGEELLAVPPHVISLAPAAPAPADALREQMRDVVAALKPFGAWWLAWRALAHAGDMEVSYLEWLKSEHFDAVVTACKAAADALAKLEDGHGE